MKLARTDASGLTLINTQENYPGKEAIKSQEFIKANRDTNDSYYALKKNASMLSEQERRELPISEKLVIDAIEKANKAISGGGRKFEFSIHDKTKEIMVKVIDSETDEVIREIPPEKILDLVAKIWEMVGILVDERR